VVLSVPKIVFQVVAPFFDYVGVFDFDSPSGPPGAASPATPSASMSQSVAKAVAVNHHALGLDDGDGELAPVDFQGVSAFGQRTSLAYWYS
jgi:hypothetical protein